MQMQERMKISLNNIVSQSLRGDHCKRQTRLYEVHLLEIFIVLNILLVMTGMY